MCLLRTHQPGDGVGAVGKSPYSRAALLASLFKLASALPGVQVLSELAAEQRRLENKRRLDAAMMAAAAAANREKFWRSEAGAKDYGRLTLAQQIAIQVRKGRTRGCNFGKSKLYGEGGGVDCLLSRAGGVL